MVTVFWPWPAARPSVRGNVFMSGYFSLCVCLLKFLVVFLICLSSGLHKLWYPGIRDMSTWSKFGAHGEHRDVFLFSNLGVLLIVQLLKTHILVPPSIFHFPFPIFHFPFFPFFPFFQNIFLDLVPPSKNYKCNHKDKDYFLTTNKDR